MKDTYTKEEVIELMQLIFERPDSLDAARHFANGDDTQLGLELLIFLGEVKTFLTPEFQKLLETDFIRHNAPTRADFQGFANEDIKGSHMDNMG